MGDKTIEKQEVDANSPPLKLAAIRKRRDFLLLKGAKGLNTPSFLMFSGKNDHAGDGVRIGFTVTKKLGGAVVRNRIRRRLRAASREMFPRFARSGTDYVLIARKAAYDRNYQAILDDMKRALLRLSRDTK